jgi:hypothetical protein
MEIVHENIMNLILTDSFLQPPLESEQSLQFFPTALSDRSGISSMVLHSIYG